MRVLASGIGCVVAATDCDADHVSALQHNAVASAQTKTHQRAASDGKLGSLEAVLAGKGEKKCDSEQAAEMVSCFRVGNVSALDVLAGGESITDAFADVAAADDATCKTLQNDFQCLQKNPCYRQEIATLPYTHEGKLMAEVCKANADKKLLEGAEGIAGEITYGTLCQQPTNQLLCRASQFVTEVGDLFTGCKVKCDPTKNTHKLGANLKATAQFYRSGSTKPCDDASRQPKQGVVEREADCRQAATNLHKRFMVLDKHWRPKGCYVWRNKVHWNKQGGAWAQRGRHPICVKSATTTSTTSTTK